MEAFAPAPPPPTPLQLGAISIGSAWSAGMGSMTKDASLALLDVFVAADSNFIDTANNYQNEESETWIGEWMRVRGNRDQLGVATKYTRAYRGYEQSGMAVYGR